MKIEIGKIVSAVGIRGEVKIDNWSESSIFFEPGKEIYIGSNLLPVRVEKFSLRKGMPVVKFSEVKDRTEAEKLRGKVCFADETDFEPLPEGSYYVKDLVGCRIVDLKTGDDIGELVDVLTGGSQDLYKITGDFGESLIPAVDAFIKKVDIGEKKIYVTLIEGLLGNRRGEKSK